MKRLKHYSLVILFISSLNLFSQTNQLDPIIDSCAKYAENISYNTGEVYVIFEDQNDSIVSKQTEPIVSKDGNTLVSKNISVYPNPFDTKLAFMTSGEREVSKIMIYSMEGRLILDAVVQNNQIDLANLPAGTYILKTDFDYSINFKLIKL